MNSLLLDGVFPQYCELCGLRSHRPLPLCEDCRSELPVNAHACPRCAIPLPATAPPNSLCGRCLTKPPDMDRTIAPWLYGEYMAFLIQRWKYAGQTRLTPLLAQLWLQRATTAHVDLLVPVPMHWSRRWRRGYNQAELLCRALHRTHPQLADRVASRLVRRNRPTAAQSGMDARSRNLNVRNAFTLQDRCDKLRVAIVDDVYTTGATARALSRALREAGAVHVEVWCVARTPAPV